MQEKRQSWAIFHEIIEFPWLFLCRSSLGHRSVGKRQRMEGYKQGQETHRIVQNGQKVIWSMIYINPSHLHINFSFHIRLYFNNLQYANINRGIWI